MTEEADMGSFWLQAAAPLLPTNDVGIKEALPDRIQVMSYDTQVLTVVRPRIRPRIWALVVIILFVLCTVGGMSAQIANHGRKHVAAYSCMPWDDQNCGRGHLLIDGLTSSAHE
jgi:hypothetical protein